MKKIITATILSFVFGAMVALITTPLQAGAQSGATLWKLQSNKLLPVTSSWGLTIPSLGGSGTKCLKVNNSGTIAVAAADCGSGGGGSIASINADATAAQVLAIGTAGSDFAIVDNGTGTHTFNLPTASATKRGALSTTDWSAFNAKEPAISAGTTAQYYRGDKSFQTLNTTAVPEGTNLYYTDARARSSVSASTPLAYNSSTGAFTIQAASGSQDGYLTSANWTTFNNKENAITAGTTAQYWRGDKAFATLDTAAVPENTNLYYTAARFNSAFSGKSTTDLAEGTNLYYTSGRFDTDFATKTTTNLAEGTNLYYTAGRFNTAFSGKSTDDLAQGATNKYYSSSLFNTDFSGKTTDGLAEGTTNKYFSNTLARGAVSASSPLTYNSGTGAFGIQVANTSQNGYLSSTDWNTFNGKGSGTVTSASVVSANGFAGSVATATSTPAITLSTTVTGLLKGNGTAISSATSGTDYAPATSGSSILKGNGTGGFSSASAGTDYESPLTFSTGLSRATNTVSLANTAVTPGSYTRANITVDAQGRLTSAASGSLVWGDISGTISDQTDLQTALNARVPYSGATGDVDLGANNLSAKSLFVEGTAGAGHIHLKHQSSDATATGSSTALFADVNGDIKYKNDGAYYTTLKTSLNTANRVYTFPDTSGTLVLDNVSTLSSLANVGTILSGTWEGTAIDDTYISSATTWNGKLDDIAGLVTAGTNVSITGSGTSGSPYVINASGGGGGTPAGSTGEIQFNTAGAFDSNALFAFDYTAPEAILSLGEKDVTSIIQPIAGVGGTNGGAMKLRGGDSDSISGGALTIEGGLGTGTDTLGGEVYIYGGAANGVGAWATGGSVTIAGGNSSASYGGNVILQGGAGALGSGNVSLAGSSFNQDYGEIVVSSWSTQENIGIFASDFAGTNTGFPNSMTATNNLIVGSDQPFSSITSGSFNTLIGNGNTGSALSTGSYNTALGYGANLSSGTQTGGIAIGAYASATSNKGVIGGDNTNGLINELTIGRGMTSSTAHDVAIKVTDKTGTNVTGNKFIIKSGAGTGTGETGSDILFQTSDAIGSGATQQTFTTKGTIFQNGNFAIGTASTTAPTSRFYSEVASGTTVGATIQNNGTGNSFQVNDVASDTSYFFVDASGRVGVQSSGALSNALTIGVNGTESVPAFTMGSADSDTGLFKPAADTIAFSTSGTEKVRITSSGSLAIGTISASAALHVVGTVRFASITGTATPLVVDASGNVTASASPQMGYVAKTAAYTLVASDYAVNATSGTFNLTLPTAVGITGREYILKNSGTGVITVATTSSQTIDGVTTYSLATQYKYVKVMSNGANWIVIGNN